MPIYMKYGSLTGGVTEAKHKDWIELNSFQFGVGRSITTAVGHATNREHGHPSVSEITVTKQLDISSVGLFKAVLGEAAKDVTIDFVRTGTAESGTPYEQYKLKHVLISGYSQSSGGDRPTESISLNFTNIHVEYTPTKDEHKGGTSQKGEYDITQGKVTV